MKRKGKEGKGGKKGKIYLALSHPQGVVVLKLAKHLAENNFIIRVQMYNVPRKEKKCE